MLYNLFENRDFVSVFAVALLAEGVDRNTPAAGPGCDPRKSPSSRRAWIEIESRLRNVRRVMVALLAEGVDRNHDAQGIGYLWEWSPSSRRAWIEISHYGRKLQRIRSPSSRRAWIEIISCPCGDACRVSPSSRRAWIEIEEIPFYHRKPLVALLAEGVDRNRLYPRTAGQRRRVALLAEGVDRNAMVLYDGAKAPGRPPRGGRG